MNHFLSVVMWLESRSLRAKLISMILITLALFMLFRIFFPGSTTQQESYQTGTVEKDTLVVSVTASGQVANANSGSISTNASGVVKKISVKNGETVTAGQKIAELELDPDGKQKYNQALASYQSAKNALASAEANVYSQQSKMFAANQTFINGAVERDLATSDPTYIQQQSDWLAAESNYKTQLEAVKQARMSLAASATALSQASQTISAPISGTLTGFSLQVGSVLTSVTTTSGNATSQKVASIVTDAPPIISVNLTEKDLQKVHVGNKTTVTFDALPEKTFTGKVISIDTVGSVSSGVTSYPTAISLDLKTENVYANMSATATIISEVKDDVLLVPTSAVTTSNGISTVRLMKDGKPTSVEVEKGLASSSQVEIISGLAEGDTIVTSRASTKTSGTTTSSPFSGLSGGRGGAQMMIR